MYDYALINGLVVDGTRRKPFVGAVYLKDGKIAEVSSDTSKPAKTVLDATGKVVSPGFVDIHCHSDVSYLISPTMESSLRQGITFELAGQCGGSAVPLREEALPAAVRDICRKYEVDLPADCFAATDFTGYAANFGEHGASINMSSLIGHGTLRSYVIGWEMRQLTPEELQKMCDLLEEQLRQGAPGLSLGLIYPPGSFCDTSEILALAKVVAKYDRLLAVHMRNENQGVFDAFEEMISIARQTGVKLEISHFKLMGVEQWGKAAQLIARLELARAEGIRIHCDQYPYGASSSGLTSSLPKWAAEGGWAKLAARCADDESFAKIVAGDLPEMYSRGGPDRIMVSFTYGKYPEMEGRFLSEIAKSKGVHVNEVIRDLLIKCGGQVSCTYHSIDKADMLRIMARTDIAVATDGESLELSHMPGKPHPRSTGTFARFLQTIREEGDLIPIEDCVYKMTALPAVWMGIGDRIGYLKPGYAADVTVFDYANVEDLATYQEPWHAPKGIDWVFVNGELVLDHGERTANRPGKFYVW